MPSACAMAARDPRDPRVEEMRRAVNESMDELLEVKQLANQRLHNLQQELYAPHHKIDDQKKIVANVGKARNAYVHDAAQWVHAGTPELSPSTREWMVEYAHSRAESVKVALPWKRPSNPRYPKRIRRVVHDADSSESDEGEGEA